MQELRRELEGQVCAEECLRGSVGGEGVVRRKCRADVESVGEWAAAARCGVGWRAGGARSGIGWAYPWGGTV